MVTVEKVNDSQYLISLSPNSSLVGIYRIIFLSSITLVCGGIGVIFYFLGAALILPFAGLELSILFIAFYLSFKWSSKREKIYISQDIVKVERGVNKAEYSWKEFRTFTYFKIKKEKDKTIRLSFRSKGQDIVIGEFLNEDDKKILRDEITSIIESLNLKIY
ncbi:MAG: DUF2244 domain-containing protein [SAR86 cluster bacterium]|uniref:DUF2244 domain-containing protein n=1 Tax=SAR86 cluster bacterium TaxID=2030880 RepID=A0A520N6G1_9GAMM|nr:MAG: DUF2244 domain-containing protein [SAR86 cluster bacterium]